MRNKFNKVSKIKEEDKVKIPWYKRIFFNWLFKITKSMHKKAENEVADLKAQGEIGTEHYKSKVATERKLRDTKNKLRDALANVKQP